MLMMGACAIVGDLSQLVALPPTGVPQVTPGPTRTPPPTTLVNITVTIPANTPPGGIVQLVEPDYVAGGTARTVLLQPQGDNRYTGTLDVSDGALMRYYYRLVIGNNTYREESLGGTLVDYRVTHFTGGDTLTDKVANWQTNPRPESGSTLVGVVRDGSSGQPVQGLLVNVAGQQMRTGHDGRYLFRDVPAGPINVTVYAADGRWQPQTRSVVMPGVAAQLDFGMSLARTVNVTFIVSPGRGVISGAPYYIAGDIPQLGSTLAQQQGGSVTVANRVLLLNRLDDGRLAATIPLYAGQYVHYRYTLGDGAFNGETTSEHLPRIREFLVPNNDVVITETVGTFNDIRGSITFRVTVPDDTPPTDTVAIQFKFADRWLAPVPMWPTAANEFTYVLYNPLNFFGEASYRFCRNMDCRASPDSGSVGDNPLGYRFTATVFPQTLNRRIGSWHNWRDVTPYALSFQSQVLPRPGFVAGVSLDEHWQPAWQPEMPQLLDEIQFLPASTVRLPVVYAVDENGRVFEEPGLTVDYEDLVNQIRQAQARGLRVALIPIIRPSQSSVYANDASLFWTTFAPSVDINWWNRFFEGYRRVLVNQAATAEFYGVDFLYLAEPDLSAALPGGTFAPGDVEFRWQQLLGEVRAVFSRQVVLQIRLDNAGNLQPAPGALADGVDVIDVQFQAALSNRDTPTLGELQSNAARLLDERLLPLDAFNRQVFVSIRYPSVNRAATGCPLADAGVCVPFDRFDPLEIIDPRVGRDSAEQAVIYDALLNAVNERPWVDGVFTTDYYVPVATRGYGLSVRGKPAEGVLADFFRGWLGR